MKTNFIISIRKRLLNAALGTIFGISIVFSQSQNWWRTNGNTPQSTDFLGTSNNSPLIIKTNNLERLRIAPNGFIGIANSNPQYPLDVNGRTKFRFNVYCDSLMQCGALKVNNLSGSNNGLLITDAQGNLSRFNWSGNNNDVLTGNGNWTSINTLLPSQLWQNSGQNIFYTNGNVGIGTNSPLFSLDVVGDVRVSNNVYVGGGVIISDKVNAFTEVTAPKMTASEASLSKMRADSIMMDSTKAIYGQTIVRGDVKLENKLTIQGDAKFSGNLVATQGIKFNDSIGMKYIPGNGSTPSYITLGGIPNFPPFPPINPCIFPNVLPPPVFNPGGWLQLYYNNTLLELIADGGNCIIESRGNGVNGNGGSLLLNYYCNKSVVVGGYNNNGSPANLIVNGKLGVGTSNPGCSVDIHSSGNTTGLCVVTNHSIDYGYGIYTQVSRPLTKAIAVTDNNGADQFIVWGDGFLHARELKVTLQTFNHPDYVFADDYKLLPLAELKKYIYTNRHLPGIPSADEVKKNNGIYLGEMTENILAKTEELYLYVIQLSEQIEKLAKENNQLKSELLKLKNNK